MRAEVTKDEGRVEACRMVTKAWGEGEVTKDEGRVEACRMVTKAWGEGGGD